MAGLHGIFKKNSHASATFLKLSIDNPWRLINLPRGTDILSRIKFMFKVAGNTEMLINMRKSVK